MKQPATTATAATTSTVTATPSDLHDETTLQNDGSCHRSMSIVRVCPHSDHQGTLSDNFGSSSLSLSMCGNNRHDVRR
eukprot:4202296-Amphidinium_carterae.1